MITPEPLWIYSRWLDWREGYDHVTLTEDCVIGRWFCLERASGKLRWRRFYWHPNEICGIDSGIIVATGAEGVYGISQSSGRLVWTSHGQGMWGYLARILDLIPFIQNEFRDAPRFVRDGKVYCRSGRVLDVRTGKLLERLSPDAIDTYEPLLSVNDKFYWSDHFTKIQSAAGLQLYCERESRSNPPTLRESTSVKIFAETDDGQPLWNLSVDQFNRHHDSGPYSFRLAGSFLYFVLSDESGYIPHPTEANVIIPNPTRWSLVTVDIRTGQVAQDISLGDEKHSECRIEDVDGAGLLISQSYRKLMCFPRIH